MRILPLVLYHPNIHICTTYAKYTHLSLVDPSLLDKTKMTWLSEELPNAVLQSLQSISENSTAASTNAPSILSGSAPTSSLRDVWLDVAAYYPLVSLWPMALLLSLIAINILAILLLATWRLARSSLTWSTAYKFSYSSHGTGRTERKLRLPGNGAVLSLLLCGSIAQIVEIVRWSNWGRLSWLDPVCAYAHTAALYVQQSSRYAVC